VGGHTLDSIEESDECLLAGQLEIVRRSPVTAIAHRRTLLIRYTRRKSGIAVAHGTAQSVTHVNIVSPQVTQQLRYRAGERITLRAGMRGAGRAPNPVAARQSSDQPPSTVSRWKSLNRSG
jgi:hypothetical protein